MGKQNSTIKHNLLVIFISMAIGVIITGVFSVIIRSVISEVDYNEIMGPELNIYNVLIYGIAIISLISPITYSCVKYCPFCHKLKAKVKIRKFIVDRRKGYKKVYGNNGSITQIRVMKEIYQIDYRCKYCGNEWSTQDEKERQNFYE